MPKTEVGRAKSLLRKINKELSTIPDYDFSPNSLKMGTGETPAIVKAMGNATTALRRGLRAMKGKDSEGSLKLKRKRVIDLIEETKELTDGKVGYGGEFKEGQTKFVGKTKAEVITEGNKRRRGMK
jgi:hypothetical protein